jgi:RNA polymerase sigma factor (sigma-70 family)
MKKYGEMTNEELYEMCIRGDDGAWTYVYNYILKHVKWWIEDREDLAGEVFTNLMEKGIKMVKNKNSFKQYINSMIYNEIKGNFKEKFKHEVPMSNLAGKNDEGEEYVQEIGFSEENQIEVISEKQVFVVVDEVLNALPDKCRTVVKEYLNYKMDKYNDYEELSSVLGMKEGTISSIVTRSLRKVVQLKEIAALRELL